jgi:cation diffusion facilitator CzcD-associated flavoprotein CzcO
MSASYETDRAQLCTSVGVLDPIVALLSLVHLTGDRALLTSLGDALQGTQRTVQAFFGEGGARLKVADPAVVAQIRKRLVDAVLTNPVPLLPRPDRALFRQMARLCLGVELDDAAFEMAREQAGFVTDERTLEPTRIPPGDFSVLVLGAGMIGINAAIKLKAAGFDFRVIEQCDEVGGTWSVNTYPNAAVDTPSVQYSYSFEQNASWSKYFPTGPEYLAYLKGVAKKYGIVDRIDFNTTMKGCEWDGAHKLWKVTCVRNGSEHIYNANVVISALGFLNQPAYPDVEGLESFFGPVVHSARWDASIDFAGKKVVVVGTGCTAVQLATSVAETAADLTIIQRQPNWLLPNEQVLQSVGHDERWGLENIPFVLQWRRLQSLAAILTAPLMATIDPQWRERTGGVNQWSDAVRQSCLDYIEAKFADRPDLRVKVTPDFPFFAKRPIIDCGYYDTLKKQYVHLVEGALVRCEEGAVILADGTRVECDVLLLATGFTLDFLSGFDIRGTAGRTLQSVWSPYPYAYLGLEVPGFPNFFVTCGPNSALTASHTTLGEQQVHYIIEMLQAMVENELAATEVTQEACDRYNAPLYEHLERTIWVKSGTAHGYYRHASGRVVLGYPWNNARYWAALRQPVLADHLFTLKDTRPLSLDSRKEVAVG